MKRLAKPLISVIAILTVTLSIMIASASGIGIEPSYTIKCGNSVTVKLNGNGSYTGIRFIPDESTKYYLTADSENCSLAVFPENGYYHIEPYCYNNDSGKYFGFWLDKGVSYCLAMRYETPEDPSNQSPADDSVSVRVTVTDKCCTVDGNHRFETKLICAPYGKVLGKAQSVCTVCGLKNEPYDIIAFGAYPQKKVSEKSLIASLNEAASEKTPIDFGYRNCGSDSVIMSYVDVNFNGKQYRGVNIAENRTVFTTENNSFSSQKNNGYSAGSTYWFAFEPLLWKITDAKNGTAVCENIIDSQPFGRSNDYGNSSVRKMLNEDFYQTAFSDEEQLLIRETGLDNTGYNNIYNCVNTNDRIYLLSLEEVKSTASINENLYRYGTDYSFCQGLTDYDSDGNHQASYLLRTASDSESFVCSVDGNNIAYSAYFDDTSRGILPAANINLDGFSAPSETVTVEFRSDDTVICSFSVPKGSGLSYIPSPVKKGFEFSGWDIDIPSEIKSNTVFNAVWNTEAYSLTFMANGEVFDTKYYYAGDIIEYPDTETLQNFLEWTYLPERMPDSNLTAYAIQYTDICYGEKKQAVPGEAPTVFRFVPEKNGNYSIFSSSDNGADPYTYMYEIRDGFLYSLTVADDSPGSPDFNLHADFDSSCEYYLYIYFYNQGDGTPIDIGICCSHSEIKNWVITEKATCTVCGSRQAFCPTCGESITESYYEDHIPETVTIPSTCTEWGAEIIRCSVCEGIYDYREIAPSGHTTVSFAGIAPTCEKAGKSAGKYCSVCNKIFDGMEELPAKGHSPVTVPAKEATCTEYGHSEWSFCSVCNTEFVKKEIIPITEHNYKTEITKEASPFRKGVISRICINCNHTESTEYSLNFIQSVKWCINRFFGIFEKIGNLFG